MSVQALTQFDPTQFFNLPSAIGTAPQRLDTKVSGVAVSTDFSGRLSVTTAEGDKITLSADIESDFRAVNYKSHVEGDGGTVDVKGKYAEYSLKQEFGVTVEGDLNEQEVKDLASLFRKVANIFKKVLSGQDDAALAKTTKLADRFEHYSSLSDLSLNIDLERSVTRFAAALTGEVAGQPGTPAALPATTPPASTSPAPTTQAVTQGEALATAAAIPPPSSDTTPSDATPQASTTEAVTQGEAPTTDAVIPPPSTGITVPTQVAAPASGPSQPSSIVQQVLDAIQSAQVEPRKLNNYFSQFLKNLGNVLQHGRPGERPTEGTQTNQTPTVPAQTGTVAYLAYQSTHQSRFSLSIHT
ncbi:MAG: hypothetical protein HOP32_10025 [Nitrospira sp.]|nr:hypothetical protein [Nitrospira sp.]